MMPLWLALLFVPLLIALNAFFVAAEYAVVAIRPPQIAAQRSAARRIADAGRRPLPSAVSRENLVAVRKLARVIAPRCFQVTDTGAMATR